MKYCTNCGAQLPDEAKFCESCGTRQQAVLCSTRRGEKEEIIRRKNDGKLSHQYGVAERAQE